MVKIKLCKEVYLDNAATTRFKPRAVGKEMLKNLRFSANPGRSGHKSGIDAAMTIENCRDNISLALGGGNVVFTKNCTEALNVALFGLNLSGEVVTSVCEHNSVLRPLKLLESKGHIRVKYIKPEKNIITLNSVTKMVNKDTRLVVLSEMSNVTGAVHEIEKIAQFLNGLDIKLVVDTAQSLGHTTTNYKNVHILAASGHKGLHGPQGTGFLCFKNGVKLNPLILGGTGTAGLSLEQPKTPPEGFESGTLNTLGIAGLNQGALWTFKNLAKITKNAANLSNYLLQELKAISNVEIYTKNASGVVTFNIKNTSSQDVANILDAEYNISVRAGLHCAPLMHRHLGTLQQGAVRASFGYDNTDADVEKLIEAVYNIAKR
jgi:selenocysteine lyase/cysteine desulfurase